MFNGRGLKWALASNNCTLYLDIFYFLWGIYAPVGGGAYRVRLHPWWWVILLFKWNMVWGCGCYWFILTSCLVCQVLWYGSCLRLHLFRWLVTIFLFPTIFVWVSVVLSLVFSMIFPWNMYATFLSASSFMCLRLQKGRVGFFINYEIGAWWFQRCF